MQAQQVAQDDFDFADTLDTLELELALQFLDVPALGFDNAIDAALSDLNGQILFRLPKTSRQDASEIAAVSIPSAETGQRKLLLIILGEDKKTVRVENASANPDPVADLAQSMAGLLDCFAASSAREDEAILL